MYFKNRKSVIIPLIATLAALHAVLSFFPGVWRRWSIILIPLEGFIGGPVVGFIAAFFGSLIGRMLKPDAIFFENLFGIAEALGALVAGLMIREKWRLSLLGYVGMLAFFIISPNSQGIPLWTLWDVYLALILIIPAAYLIKRLRIGGDRRLLILSTILASFIAVEFDVLVRIIMFVPLGLFTLYPIPSELLPEIFIVGAFTTPIEALYTVIVTVIVGVPLLIILKKNKIVDWPLT